MIDQSFFAGGVRAAGRFCVLTMMAFVMSACTSLPGPPGDPTKFRRTKVDGPGQLSKVAYGEAETPRNLPKSRSGNRSTYNVFGQEYSVLDSARGFREVGVASWYGTKFHGRHTASGEIYNMYNMTAAHKHLPLPTFVRVTNMDNGKQLVVKVNDRGPFVDDRIIDLSYGAAARLGVLEKGTARVEIMAISENISAEDAQITQVTKAPTKVPAPPTANSPQSAAKPQYVEILASGKGVADVGLPGAKQVLPGGEVVRQSVAVPRREAPTSRKTAPAAIAQQPTPATTAMTAQAAIQSGVVIQVGAFSDPQNAESMRQRVNRAVNDDAAIIHANSSRTLLRVQIGPLPAEAPIEQIVNKLKTAGINDIALYQY